jgi:ribosomal protein L37AE/L43A
MSAPELVFKMLTAKALPIYTCDECGATAFGDTVTIQLNDINASRREIGTLLANEMSISNSHMPAGWAGFGRSSHRCPNCKEKK